MRKKYIEFLFNIFNFGSGNFGSGTFGSGYKEMYRFIKDTEDLLLSRVVPNWFCWY